MRPQPDHDILLSKKERFLRLLFADWEKSNLTTFIKILPPHNLKLFDNPPVFTGEQRKQLFKVQKWVLELLETISNPINKVGFVLQLGYFRAVNKFFTNKKYHHQTDIEYIARNLKINLDAIDLLIRSKDEFANLRSQFVTSSWAVYTTRSSSWPDQST